MPTRSDADEFLRQTRFAVVGASGDRAKYGNKVLRCYLQHGLDATPIHPTETEVEGRTAYPSVSAMPEPPEAVSIITPPRVTERVVEELGTMGVRHVWMQPGAESPEAVRRAQELGMNVLAGGPCLLVKLGFRDR